MCGDWGSSRCSAKKWFKFMGDAEGNVYVPFQINYLVQPDNKTINGYTPLDPKIVPCHERLNVII